MRQKQNTAEYHAKNLKEHREAFESINGVPDKPLADFGTEISGLVAEIALRPYITEKELKETARLIRELSDKKLKYMQGVNAVCQMLGYIDLQTAQRENADIVYIRNKNFERKDVAALHQEIHDNLVGKELRVRDLLRPVFEQVAAQDDDVALFDKLTTDLPMSAQGWIYQLRPVAEKYGIDTNDIPTFWTWAFVMAYRYRSYCGVSVRKGCWRNRDISGRGTADHVGRELREEFFPKPPEVEENDHD